MDNQEIEQKVKELSDIISQHQKELDDIRNQCEHKNYKIELYHSEKDSNIKDLMRVCLICGKPIGYPNEEEFKKWALVE